MTVAGDDAQQTFLPWLRRGLATALTADGATFDGARASLRVAVELEHTVEPRGAPLRTDNLPQRAGSVALRAVAVGVALAVASPRQRVR